MYAQDQDLENESHADPSGPTAPSASLRPLTNGRFRTEEVDSQIRWLLALPFPETFRHITQRDLGGQPLIKEETLVYLLRQFRRSNDARAAGKIAEELLKRSAARIYNWVAMGIYKAPDVHCEQCIEAIQTQMFIDIQNDGPGCEFWEIAFWLCLKRRAMNCLERYRRIIRNEVHPTAYVDDNGDETSLLETLPDPTLDRVQNQMEMQDALSKLPTHQRQAVQLLYFEQWTQQQIADHFGVADRTIRNWISAALKSLRAYYGGSL